MYGIYVTNMGRVPVLLSKYDTSAIALARLSENEKEFRDKGITTQWQDEDHTQFTTFTHTGWKHYFVAPI